RIPATTTRSRFPADYPILSDYYWTTESIKYRRLSGRPRIQGRPLNGFRPHFPIKAPTRQMLYPLSYRGTFNPGMLANQSTVSTARDRLIKQTKRDRPVWATSS